MNLWRLATASVGLLWLLAALWMPAAGAADKRGVLYPDLRTVVPTHLQLVNAQQREILRFSNGIANTGAGPWALRPDPPISQATTTVSAVQEIRDSGAVYRCGEQPKQVAACYTVVSERVAGRFEFHPAHNHWHIGDVALFEVRKGAPSGAVVGGNAVKTTVCLLDSYTIDGNARTSERVFWDCYMSFQGISTGWVDQYHHPLEGQQLDLTGVPEADDYYLVSASNYARTYLESDYTNNTAWVRFRLYRDSNGNRKVQVTGHSPCDGSGLCGEPSTNR